MQAHFRGKRHQRRLGSGGRTPEGGSAAGGGLQSCPLCCVTTTSVEHMELHLAGKAHQRKLRILAVQRSKVLLVLFCLTVRQVQPSFFGRILSPSCNACHCGQFTLAYVPLTLCNFATFHRDSKQVPCLLAFRGHPVPTIKVSRPAASAYEAGANYICAARFLVHWAGRAGRQQHGGAGKRRSRGCGCVWERACWDRHTCGSRPRVRVPHVQHHHDIP